MAIKDYIQITENNLPLETISSFIKFCKRLNYEKGSLVRGDVDESVRKVKIHSLSRFSSSLTEVHWCNLLYAVIQKNIVSYNNKFKYFHVDKITDISVLKYEDSGHYDWHTDHCAAIPRTISVILLFNNDYKGGTLSFYDAVKDEKIDIETKPGRMIMWPSNFIFPHKVNPVEQGIRYSVVSWAV
jgi:predicted 2-oxoglutarate/Fe(II)-dependent dioxygenase YbiX